ncbi:MAG: hypothetical protein PHF72_14310, partial [Gammaproteobacteria bacterium]|nr:hypothetical protein [Gammaproteobacteria bacterium]
LSYRLLFNLQAAILLLPPLWLTYSYEGEMLCAWRGAWFWVANGIAALAAAGFLWSLRWYDGREFLGLRQWREREASVEDQERLHLSPLHRWVRHPWYFLGLLIIWTRDMNLAWLLSAVLASVYLWIGSRFEERKLLVYHGEAYRRYRERVPALIPLPWRRLDAGEAARLARAAARRNGGGRSDAD